MATPSSPLWRFCRTVMVAALASVTAAAGHGLAGGDMPATSTIAGVTMTVGLLVALMTRRALRPAPIFLVLLLTQLAFHVLFASESMPAMSGEMMDAASHPASVMIGMHVLAALLTAAVVAGADRALYEVSAPVRLVRLLLSTLEAIPLPSGAGATRFDDTCLPGPAQQAHRDRGPPFLLARSG